MGIIRNLLERLDQLDKISSLPAKKAFDRRTDLLINKSNALDKLKTSAKDDPDQLKKLLREKEEEKIKTINTGRRYLNILDREKRK